MTYQYPKKFEADINAAIALYTEGGSSEILAPTWDESIIKFKKAEKQIIKYDNHQVYQLRRHH